jgi:hypothetical protein
VQDTSIRRYTRMLKGLLYGTISQVIWHVWHCMESYELCTNGGVGSTDPTCHPIEANGTPVGGQPFAVRHRRETSLPGPVVHSS